MPDFWIPSGVGISEFTEKKSRFLGEALGVTSPAEAKARVKALKEEHPRSRHVAWAFVLGKDGALHGLSDDGEPHGTAGKPILDPIVGAQLTNTLVTVVRYFGGVKLGTGGLVSAYGKSCQDALATLERIPLIERQGLRLYTDYAHYEVLRRGLDERGAVDVKEEFTADVFMESALPLTAIEEFEVFVADATCGTARLEWMSGEASA
ncbi:MAG: IMPACT family protein [Spirochaetales bacterium]|nr:IMPACT family protein [Spirochaetales bacterium]